MKIKIKSYQLLSTRQEVKQAKRNDNIALCHDIKKTNVSSSKHMDNSGHVQNSISISMNKLRAKENKIILSKQHMDWKHANTYYLSLF